jgi:hypothetical protein
MAQKKRKRGESLAKKEEETGLASQEEQEASQEEQEDAELASQPETQAAMAEQEPNQPETSGDKEERRSSMAVEEMKVGAEKIQNGYKEIAKVWKDGYLRGLDAYLQLQAENEHLIKDTVKQGFSGSRQFFTWWKDWIEGQTQRQAEIQRDIQRQMNNKLANNVTNPFLGFTKQSTEAVLATVEPILKNSEEAVDSTFGYYENTVATPSRKYVREINQQVLDAVIPG